MMRFLTVCLGVLLMTLAWPQSSRAGAPEVKNFIDSLGQQTLEIANDRAQALSQRRSKLEKIFLDNVDLDKVAKFVLGKYWRDASDEQKARYLQAYRQFASKSYSSKFDDYNNFTYKINDAVEQGEDKYLVRMTIDRPRQQPITVDYYVKDNHGSYLLYDLAVESVSMVVSQRDEFVAAASRKGIDGLINDLQSKASLMDQGGSISSSKK